MRSFFAAVGPSALPLAPVCVSVWLSACLSVCGCFFPCLRVSLLQPTCAPRKQHQQSSSDTTLVHHTIVTSKIVCYIKKY